MKEATGELSMVVITLIAVVAILVLWNTLGPELTEWVTDKFDWMQEGHTECPTGQTYDSTTKSCK